MSEIVVGWRLAGVPKRTSRSDTGVQEGLQSFKGERMRCKKLGGDGNRMDLWKAEATNVLDLSVRDNDAT